MGTEVTGQIIKGSAGVGRTVASYPEWGGTMGGAEQESAVTCCGCSWTPPDCTGDTLGCRAKEGEY